MNQFINIAGLFIVVSVIVYIDKFLGLSIHATIVGAIVGGGAYLIAKGAIK